MTEPVIDAAACAAWLISPVGRDTGAQNCSTPDPPYRDNERQTPMEVPALPLTDEEEDPDMTAIIEALAYTHEVKAALLPVMLRMEERRRCRLAKRLQRAQKSALPAEDRKSA